MELIEYLKRLIEKTNEKLTRLIAKYDDMENLKLIDESRQVFDDLRLYIKLKNNRVLPLIKANDGTTREQIRESLDVDGNIEYMLEKLVMIHVDNPYHEYQHKLEKLKEYVDQAETYDKTTIYPLIDRVLSDRECDEIISRIKDEQMHEAKASILTNSDKAN